MSLNERKREAEALIRSSWCNTNEFHDWTFRNSWVCTPCLKRRIACAFSNYAVTHCDNCSSTSCSARLDFRKALFTHTFGITDEMYDAWTHEWRMKSKTGASPVLAYPDGLPQHTATASHNGPGSTRSVSQVSRSPRTPGAQPEPSLTQASENASLVSSAKAMASGIKAPGLSISGTVGGQAVSAPSASPQRATHEGREVQLAESAKSDQVPNVPNVSNINVDNQPPPPSVAAPADTSPSIPHPLDAHIRFFKALREASDRHLKALMEHKAEQERHQAKENEMKEQIRALEQKLKESQDSQESLRSRFRAIVQDLQEEVQRESYPVKDEADNPKKRKMEDEEELVYPSQRVRQSN